MTKKDFEQLALCVRMAYDDCNEPYEISGVSLLERNLVEFCERSNENFDSAKFRKACGHGE